MDRHLPVLEEAKKRLIERAHDHSFCATLQCERAARLQLLAKAAGNLVELNPRLAREAHDWILQDKRSKAPFVYFARRALASSPAVPSPLVAGRSIEQS